MASVGLGCVLTSGWGADLLAADSLSVAGAEKTVERPGLLPAGGGAPAMQLEALPWVAPDARDNLSTPAKVELGRLLFFDPVLSSTRDVACATCHHPRFGWADARSAPIGTGGVGRGPARVLGRVVSFSALTRNAPTVLNVGFNGLVAGAGGGAVAELAPMFWDARAAGLEQQALVPLRTLGEMCGENCAEDRAVPEALGRVRAIGEYRERFRRAFPEASGDAITAANLARALATFERSLVNARTPFDRFMRGDRAALSAEQLRGMQIFKQAGCVECHGGPMFSDYQLHFLGVSDPTVDGRRPMRTPTLRNLRRTAPYMHNGSLSTLRDVLVFYEALGDAVSETLDGGEAESAPALDPLLRRLHVDPADFSALEAFLEALDDGEEDSREPSKVPSGLSPDY